MTAKLCDLQRKELVNVKDGAKIGYVDDAIVDIDTAAVKFLVVHGRLRLFGLLGRRYQRAEANGKSGLGNKGLFCRALSYRESAFCSGPI